jgi:hypothetical protein
MGGEEGKRICLRGYRRLVVGIKYGKSILKIDRIKGMILVF